MDDIPSLGAHRPTPPRLPVTDISQWLERYSIMSAIISSRFPHKAPELFAYQALIVRAERNYESNRWVSYDRQFRREALACKDLNWSVPDARLYNEAFTGRAHSIARCTFCLQDDHPSNDCPRNPNRSLLGWLQDTALWPAFPRPSHPSMAHPAPGTSQGICRRFNRGRCNSTQCRYFHACQECRGPHPWSECPRNPSKPAGRSRSPQRRPQQAWGFPQNPTPYSG